jgi:hypothetical protein
LGSVASCEFDDGFTSFERIDDVREFRFEARQQLRASSLSNSNPDDGWIFVQQSMDCEVFVLRNDRGADFRSFFPNVVVRRGQQSTISNVLSAVSKGFNSSCQRRRELCDDEKQQSRAPQNWVIVLPGGELEDRSDVVALEIQIVREDLFVGGRQERLGLLRAVPVSRLVGMAGFEPTTP